MTVQTQEWRMREMVNDGKNKTVEELRMREMVNDGTETN